MEKTVIVFLDSTTLKSDKNRNSYNFSILSRLAKEKSIKIHLSEMNKREFTSAIEHDFDTTKDLISKKLNSISEYLSNGEITIPIDEIERSKCLAIQEFEKWLSDSKCTIHEINQFCSNVFDSYFTGKPPFSGLKHRPDIPDSFIFECVKKVTLNNPSSHVYFISEDEKFRNHIKSTAAIPIKNLKDFISLPNISSLIRASDEKIEAAATNRNINRIKEIISQNIEEITAKKSSIIASEISKMLIDCRYSDFPVSGNIVSAWGIKRNEIEVKFNKETMYIIFSGLANARIEYDLPSHKNWNNDAIDLYDDFHESENWSEHNFMASNIRTIGFIAEIIPTIKIENLKEYKDEEVISAIENSITHIDFVKVIGL